MPIFNKDTRTEYHLITCDHPLMIDAGMSSFTLPQFKEWWYFRDGTGEYVNQKVFYDAESDNRIKTVLGHTPSDYDVSFCVDVWRFEGYNVGRYQKYAILKDFAQNVDPWEYYNENPDAPEVDKDTFDIGHLQLNDVKGKQFNRITKLFHDDITEGVYAADLIALNDYYNIVGYNLEKEEDRATRQFFKDIRRSKNAGYVSWRNNILLNLRLIEGAEPCVSEEEFNFKLYLFDKKRPVNRTKSEAVSSINIAASAMGADGANNLGKADGDHNLAADGAPGGMVGGPLKFRFIPIDGTFSAGSEQIHGIVYSNTIPKANLPNLELDEVDVAEYLQDPLETSQITPGTGLAIPIDVQNANPFQWMANYANPAGCRGENKEKIKLQVFNMNPKSFKKGDYVKITSRDGLWWIDDLSVSDEEPPLATLKDVSEWQFTYHITNQRYHFRFADPNTPGEIKTYDAGQFENTGPVDAFAMEDAIAKKYLAARTDSEWSAKYGSTVAHQVVDEGKTWPGYAQITSFDYMGKEFGGLRGDRGNALVLTDNRRSYDGTLFGQFDDTGKQCGKWTVPFFGCTFPKGYNDEAKYTNLNSDTKDAEGNLTGRGWRPGVNTKKTGSGGSQEDIAQNDSFFDLDQFVGGPYGVDGTGHGIGGAEDQGIFNPLANHNNKSTNAAPEFFLTQQEKDAIDPDNGHVNLFSAGHQMYHVPADVLTNGPFTAENGGPILNLNNVQKYITDPDIFGTTGDYPKDNIYNSYHDFWLDPTSFQFLYDTIDRNTREPYEKDDKAILDFKPVDTRNVLFRPLRDAVFSQYDQRTDQIIPNPLDHLRQCGFSNYGAASVDYGKFGRSTVGGGSPIFGSKTKKRILEKDKKSLSDGEDQHHLVVKQQRNDFLKDSDLDIGDNNQVIPFEYYIYKDEKRNSYEYRVEGFSVPMGNPDLYGGREPNALGAKDTLTDDDQTRGGFGVIGARATAECEGGFVFVSDTYIGQDSIFNTNVNQHEAMLGSKTQLLYNQASTTQLFVKVYQAWPRDQTIFDSRFFAVHHFNEGNKFPVGVKSRLGKYQRPWEYTYRSKEKVQDSETFPDASFNPLEYDPLTQMVTGVTINQTSETTYTDVLIIDKDATNVDMRIPQYFNKDSSGAGTHSSNGGFAGQGDAYTENYLAPVGTGRLVFNEGALTEEDDDLAHYVLEGETLTEINLWAEQFDESEREDRIAKRRIYQQIAPTGYWKVDPVRRGRLLPWIYNQTTIRLPNDLTKAMDTAVNPEATLADLIKAQKKYLIVQDMGEGYNLSDTLKIESATGSNAIARVAEIGEGGSIKRLEWTTKDTTILGETINYVYRGEGFLPSDFPAGSTTGINEDTKSDLEFLPHLNFEGSGYSNRTFKGYIMAGFTENVEKWDYKPQVATETKEPYVLGTPNNTVDGTSNPAFRTENNIQIIPIGAVAIVLGQGANTFFTVPQENIEPTIGRQVTTVVLSGDPTVSNPNVLTGTFPKFDMFFQFHGDISHQGIAGGANKPSFFENFIDLSINPF